MSFLYADVALPVPIHRLFTYSVPGEFRPNLKPGCRVLVPFGPSTQTGVVTEVKSVSDVEGIRPIRDLLDVLPAFTQDLMVLTRWIADYYLAPWGEVLRAAAPHGFAIESHRIVALTGKHADANTTGFRLGKSQLAVVQALEKESPLSFEVLKKRTKLTTIASAVHTLAQREFVVVSDSLKRPKASVKKASFVRLTSVGSLLLRKHAEGNALPRGGRSLLKLIGIPGPAQDFMSFADLSVSTGVSPQSLRGLINRGYVEEEIREIVRDPYSGPVEPPKAMTLSKHQAEAVAAMTSAVSSGTYAAFLLRGITGSGKTQVYIEALRHTLAAGKSGIVLVPEISLTPQTVRRFRSHFGDQIAVMHSQLSDGERFDAWRRSRDGSARVVIGPRSAVFAPLENIGLIVVDEEHDGSYKQYDATPRYHGRDTAVVRARMNNAVVVLGSATPSMESAWNSEHGKYRLLELPDRIDDAQLPVVELVDMRSEHRRRYERIKEDVKKTGTPFPKRLPPMSVSGRLEDEIRLRLERKEGIILLQNRRGFAHVLECLDCGYTERCRQCDVTMTFHIKTNDLRCHYCGARRSMVQTCPNCHKGELRQQSFGTQQVHQELASLFPSAKIARMDRDTTRRKGSHEMLLRKFALGEADILLGTQMVAKGLDFPHVTLVGVISAETQLLLPDFRAAELTFQLLTQVAGRAGRSRLKGEVVIQTYQPAHYSLQHAVEHNTNAFTVEELSYRRELKYPPFSRLVLIECTGKNEGAVRTFAEGIAKKIRAPKLSTVDILGPAEPVISQIRGFYRRHIIIKSDKTSDPSAESLRKLLAPLIVDHPRSKAKMAPVRMTIDVDPYGMM